MMEDNFVNYCLYDSFSSQSYSGNAAGVVLHAERLDQIMMQNIAAELNISTTGFVKRKSDYELEVRFFTPIKEINMCGHVLIAVFTALLEEKNSRVSTLQKILVSTKAGQLEVEAHLGSEGFEISMRQNLPVFEECDSDQNLILNALGISDNEVLNHPIQIVSTGLRHLIIPLTSLDVIEGISLNAHSLVELSKKLRVDTICPFTMETKIPDSTVHCRDLCAGIGHLEEPGSGTTAGSLSSYLVRNKIVNTLASSTNIEIQVEQGFEMDRPSIIKCVIKYLERSIREVKVSGVATLTARGEIKI